MQMAWPNSKSLVCMECDWELLEKHLLLWEEYQFSKPIGDNMVHICKQIRIEKNGLFVEVGIVFISVFSHLKTEKKLND